ncbi:ATP-binding protein [Paramaledivibacter caminithermalis]|uniref:ATP-binding protein n=1 Tax=Paramaledivibacter caminithermalis TaxID=191027 RepID=UPI0038CD7C59
MSKYDKGFEKKETRKRKSKLDKYREELDTYIDLITNKEKTVVDALYELTKLEIRLKEEKATNTCVKVANFPFIKTLDDFDFTFQPSINQNKIKDLPR